MGRTKCKDTRQEDYNKKRKARQAIDIVYVTKSKYRPFGRDYVMGSGRAFDVEPVGFRVFGVRERHLATFVW